MKIIQSAEWQSYSALKQTFNSASKVGRHIVFNGAGNNYRIVAIVDFDAAYVHIKHVLTHAEYDRLDIRKL